MDRRSFFSRLAGVALLPALAKFAPKPVITGFGYIMEADGVRWRTHYSDGSCTEKFMAWQAPCAQDHVIVTGTRDTHEPLIQMDWLRINPDGRIRPI